MRIISIGFLLCLISLYIMIGFEGTSGATVGGLSFWMGVIVTLVGVFYKKK